MLLCDYAEELGGKLYIMGGGWSRIPANTPQAIALAVRLLVPWDLANRKHKVEIVLLTEDGQPVKVDEAGMEIKVEGAVEVGRPPGLRPGSALEAPLAMRFPLSLKPGSYRFDFSVDGTLITSASFEAIGQEGTE